MAKFLVIHTPTGECLHESERLADAAAHADRQRKVTAILTPDDRRVAHSPYRGYYVAAGQHVHPGERPRSESSRIHPDFRLD